MPARISFSDDLLRRLQAGEAIDFDALARQHPEHAAAIEKARAVHELLRSLEPGTRPSGSFTAKLRQHYGEGVDPEISLDGGRDEPSSAASSELLRLLSEKGLKGSRYQLKGEVARGGMGAILRVWDEELRRSLAMKVILGRGESPAAGGTPTVEPSQLARFLEEAQVTSQLDHPGIVPVHELGLDAEGRVYFTMKLVKGRDLKAVFDLVFDEKEGWNETRALSVIQRACEALAYAHAKGVIHRDLKPANVMVGNFGEVYVMDWGLARVLNKRDAHDIRLAPEVASALSSVNTERRDVRELLSDSPLVTMDGDVVGTPAYMSPEQARGEIEKLGPRSDVYSVGAMLYHLLARQAPYVPRGVKMTNRTVLGLVLQGQPESLAKLRPDAPAELVAIVDKAMAREAPTRYADTVALGDDLRAFLEHRVVRAYETGAWAETKKWVQRNKPLAASLAGAVVLLVAGLTASLVFKSRADQRAADLQSANTTIRNRNVELAAATKSAQDNEALALAQKRASKEKADVLFAIDELQTLIAKADSLWPAFPENLDRYDEWIQRATWLAEGRPSDPARGWDSMPSLEDHRRALARLRERALPRSDAENLAEDQKHPRWDDLQSQRGRLVWFDRMLGTTPWRDEKDVQDELTQRFGGADAQALNEEAWLRIDPDRKTYGEEELGLALARRAVERANGEHRWATRDSLAWALFATGHFDEALAEERTAIREVVEGGLKKFAGQQVELEGSLAKLESAVKLWRAPVGGLLSAERREAREKLAKEVSSLDSAIAMARRYEYPSIEENMWEEKLSKLIADVEVFSDNKYGLDSMGTSEAYGWGIRKRRQAAATIRERSTTGAEADRRWDEAIAAIAASAKYGGLKLEPQIGLLPLGVDPASGLWEFADVQTGEPAQRGADGRLVLDEKLGLVFVLIPGGTFTLGAQKEDAAQTNYDPNATPDEKLYSVTLDAYFLSKYEMTQGQWERFVGKNPSFFGSRNYGPNLNRGGNSWTGLHPVEMVSWVDCDRGLHRLGMVLPTEAQWERGCRGSTATVYWSGDEAATLVDAGNIADQYAKHNGDQWNALPESWDDGNACHAAVGGYHANGLGLHDTHGNVWEWCKDRYGLDSRFSPVDGERQVTGASQSVARGGSFGNIALYARSAFRGTNPSEAVNSNLGVRPARACRLATSQSHLEGK